MRIPHTVVAALMVMSIAASASGDPQTVSRLGWVTNGQVQAAVQVGNTLYIGGSFTRVAPRTGVLGSFFGVSATTGELTTGLPLVDGAVNAVEPDGLGGYYIGGSFTTVGGVPRNRLAHVLSGGTVDPTFAPIVDGGVVLSIRRGATSLFVGGSLLQVNGGSQQSFVALEPTTGASVPWPVFATTVTTLLVHTNTVIAVFDGETGDGVGAFDQGTGTTVWGGSVSDGTIINAAVVAGPRLILGGRFNDFPDVLGVISIDVTTGIRDATWEPDKTFAPGPQFPRPEPVEALAVSGDTLYVGGAFTEFGSQPRAHAAAVTISTGTLAAWAPTADGKIVSLLVSPGGTVFMGGSFAHVNGEVRGDFAEVDAGGTLTEWVTDASWQGGRSLVLDNGTLVIGTRHGVRGGGARTNLAAFDLSTDTLLPWAPVMSDTVSRLAAAADTIYIGSSRFALLPGGTVNVVSTVHAVTGATLPFAPPGVGLDGYRLLGAVGSHAYISGDFFSVNSQSVGTGIRRFDPMGVADPSWFVPGARPTHMAVSENVLYFADASTIWVADVTTGTFSQWNPELVPPISSIHGLAVDGRTLYVAVQRTSGGGTATSIAAFDRVSRLPVVGMPESAPALQLLGNTVRAIAVADGQIALAGSEVVATSPGGPAPLWNSGLTNQPGLPSASALLVTPTDVIVLGYEADIPVPVYGIAVFSRTPSVAPTSLRGTTADNLVTLTWDAPSIPPPGGYVLDVAAQSGSSNPISLPTGNQDTSIVGVAGNGTFYVRARAAGAAAGPASLPTNEIALVVGCTAPPTAPPLNLAAHVSGSNVTITWTAPPFTSASAYVLEAGSSAGATNIGTFTIPASQTSIAGTGVPAGAYFVRMHSTNSCGASDSSSEIFFTVGGPSVIPAAPTGLAANVVGSLVGVQWNPPPGALGYLVEVGSAPGLSDIATLPLSAFNFVVNGVPTGIYHLRVRAGNGAGLSAPSSDVVIVVPQ